MAKIMIDMPKFNEYINEMCKMVERLVDSNTSFTLQIEKLENDWCDDIYKRVRNQLFRLQSNTNLFIKKLDELDNVLVSWYRLLCEKYFCENYSRPLVEMPRVKIKDEQVERHDEKIIVSFDALCEYVLATRKYTLTVRDELSFFQNYNRKFEEFFQTKRYEEIMAQILPMIKNMTEILNEMDACANFVDKKKEVIASMNQG